MKKIIFCDMDGTIIEDKELYHHKDIENLCKLQEQGHYVVFNTGRNLQEFLMSAKTLNLPYDYAILSNGGHIIDKDLNDIAKFTIDTSIACQIIEAAMQYDFRIYYYDGNRTMSYYNGQSYVYRENSIHGFEAIDLDFVESYKKCQEFGIIALNQEDLGTEKMLKFKAFIDDKFGSEITAIQNQYYLDICPANCSKGTGVEQLSFLNATTYGVGDSYNDISMFKKVDHAYTFNRVNDEIKKHANHYVDYVYEIVDEMLK